jgi:L-ascorbate metabolism protein UlaG (beta-lactamase superfamily)
LLAIDPFFARPPLGRLFFGQVEPESRLVAEHKDGCDDITITHAHWDHVMDVPELVRSRGATAFGSKTARRLLPICGIPAEKTRLLHAGDGLELGPYRVQVIAANHRWKPASSRRVSHRAWSHRFHCGTIRLTLVSASWWTSRGYAC